jgi:hypothetical protein
MVPGEHFGRLRGAIADVEVVEILPKSRGKIASLSKLTLVLPPGPLPAAPNWTKINECGLAVVFLEGYS